MGQAAASETTDPAVRFAFDHVAALADMLRDAGHVDMASLLDGMGDVYRIAQRRVEAAGGDMELVTPGGDALAYAVSQMNDLAELMTRIGVNDAAVLFRLPARLVAAA